jgi:hypothetical protein
VSGRIRWADVDVSSFKFMTNGDPSRRHLVHYMARESFYLREIRETYPSVWDTVDDALHRSAKIIDDVYHDDPDAVPEFSKLVGIWGSVRRYQIGSILLLFSRQLDAGLAILRMATELARILKAARRLGFSSWAEGGAAFRKATWLDAADPLEKSVLDAHDLSTKLGTHGHKLALFILSKHLPAESQA